MSVIINEFEIVTDPHVKVGDNKTESKESEATQQLSPHDIHNAIIHRAERMARIRAH